MGLFTRKSSNIRKAWKDLGKTGTSTFDAGNVLIGEEVDTLRGFSGDYREQLKDPLGATGRGVFTRARGALSDVATQRAGAFSSRLSQRALQSNLSPEARAQLEQANQREINQDLFAGNVNLSNSEAVMTLTETSKLFDRMENISKTILSVGQDQRTLGLQALIQSILGRQSLHFGNIGAATVAAGTAFSQGISASNAATYAKANQGSPSGITGKP